jgi:hypothetical protein
VLRLCQVIRPVLRLCVVIRNKYWVLRGRVVSPPPNPQAGGPPTVGCSRLLIQHIRSYPPYLEAVSCIRKPRTRHAVMTVEPFNMVLTWVGINPCASKRDELPAPLASRNWSSFIHPSTPGVHVFTKLQLQCFHFIRIFHALTRP